MPNIMDSSQGAKLLSAARPSLIVIPSKKSKQPPAQKDGNYSDNPDQDPPYDPDYDEDPFVPTTDQLAMINKFTLKDMQAQDLWVCTIRACDNQIDRHGERLQVDALQQLAGTFIGRPGLQNHSWSATQQNFRIFDADVKVDRSVQSGITGEPYTYLEMMVYMPRTQGNEDLRKEVESGIKKETSIGFFLNWMTVTCNICGDAIYDWMGKCSHIPGRQYDGITCVAQIPAHDGLEGVENSWVAVPAQPLAGATRSQKDANGEEDTRHQLLSRKEKEMEKREFLKLLSNPQEAAKLLDGLEGAEKEQAEALLAKLNSTQAPAAPNQPEPPTPEAKTAPEPSKPADAPAPQAPTAQTLGADQIAEAVKSVVGPALETFTKQTDEKIGTLAKQFEDLTTLVNAKLAPVPGGPLAAGTGEENNNGKTADNPTDNPTLVTLQKSNISDTSKNFLGALFAADSQDDK